MGRAFSSALRVLAQVDVVVDLVVEIARAAVSEMIPRRGDPLVPVALRLGLLAHVSRRLVAQLEDGSLARIHAGIGLLDVVQCVLDLLEGDVREVVQPAHHPLLLPQQHVRLEPLRVLLRLPPAPREGHQRLVRKAAEGGRVDELVTHLEGQIDVPVGVGQAHRLLDRHDLGLSMPHAAGARHQLLHLLSPVLRGQCMPSPARVLSTPVQLRRDEPQQALVEQRHLLRAQRADGPAAAPARRASPPTASSGRGPSRPPACAPPG